MKALQKEENPYPFLKSLDEHENVRLIRLKGPIDMTTLPQIQAFRKELRAQPGFQSKHVIIDFKEVTHVDTSAVAGMILVLSEIKATRHCLGVIHAQQALVERIKLLKLQQIISHYSTETEAFQALSPMKQ